MRKRRLAIILSLGVLSTVTACSTQSNNTATSETEVTTEEITNQDSKTDSNLTFTAGEYEGVGSGRNGQIKVKVILTESSIESIEILEQEETPEIAGVALETMPERIVQSQSIAVDAVAGATQTSNGIIDAVSNAIEGSGFDISLLNQKVDTVDDREAIELSTDVVVVGAGASGSSAALAALQSGANVILLEKTASPMGAGTLAGGMFAADSRLQKESGQEVDKEWLYEEYMKASEGYMNSILVRRIIDEAGATVDWLMDNGMELNLVDAGTGGAYEHIGLPATLHGYNEGGTVAITKLVDRFVEEGGEVRWSTPATELIVEDGRVVGVVAKEADGQILRISAKNVIIATGGYGGNEDMLREYVGANFTFGEVRQNTGDGINMAWLAGADEDGIEVQHYFWETFSGQDIDSLSEKIGGDWFSLTDFTMFPFLRINRNGQRFSDETKVTLFSVHGAEIAMQPGQMEYAIIDNAVLSQVAEGGLATIEDQYAKWVDNRQFYMEFNEDNDTDALYEAQHTPTDYRELLDLVAGDGVVFKADTLEELAAELSVSEDVLLASVNQYNEAITSGEDVLYFSDTNRLISVTEGPFYAIKYVARNLSTLGGIRINENMEVLDKDFNVIEGLYAVGADAGGMYGRAYVDFEGGTLGFAYTSGRLAGERAGSASINE